MSAESESSDGRKEKLSEFAELVRAKLKDSFSLKKWEGFVEEVVQWLFHEKDEEEGDVVATACGLMSYGATSKEKLQRVGRGDYDKFTAKLSAKGIPEAICDLLFEKYVASKKRTAVAGKSSVLGNIVFSVESLYGKVMAKFSREGISGRLKLPMFNEKVPAVPQKRKRPMPNIVMYDLSNSAKTTSAVYNYLHSTARLGPSALYGTSGCGKTRSLLEFLSHNYGFYFVCTNEMNPGSRDMASFLSLLPSVLARMENSTERYRVTKELLDSLILARLKVFTWLVDVLERPPTPYEWTLSQLYPEYVFGDDVFLELFMKFRLCEAAELVTEMAAALEDSLESIGISSQFHLFIDESQALLQGERLFKSSHNDEARSMYSGVLKGFSTIARNMTRVGYPKMTGTGLSKFDIDTALGSFLAKELQTDDYDAVFTTFEPLKPIDVQNYMMTMIQEDVQPLDPFDLDYICNWLCGRARFTATFLSTYLQARENIVGGGQFLVRHLDRYLRVMTCNPLSWTGKQKKMSSLLLAASAYRLFENLWSRSKHIYLTESNMICGSETLQEEVEREAWELSDDSSEENVKRFEQVSDEKLDVFEQASHGDGQAVQIQRQGNRESMVPLSVKVAHAVIQYSLSGKAVTITDDIYQSFIEKGVCFINTESGAVQIAEPIIVEAGINFLRFESLTKVVFEFIAKNASSSGFLFEEYALPFIHWAISGKNLDELIRSLIKKDTPIPSRYMGRKTIRRSAYGVIATKCDRPEETMDWIEHSLDKSRCRSVPPFCFPDIHMGSDLLVFLHDDTGYPLLSMWQLKFQTTTNLTSALRRAVPELQYVQNRGSKKQRPALDGDLLIRWNHLYDKLFDNSGGVRKRGALSVVLQSAPVKRFRPSTTPGTVPTKNRASFGSMSEDAVQSECSSDILVIHGDNWRILFKNAVTALEMLKDASHPC